ncbi:MAG: ATP-binding protein [Sphingomonas fennica]
MDERYALSDEPAGGWRLVSRPGIAILAAAALAALLTALMVLTAASGRARDKAAARERHSYEVAVVTGRLGASLARSEAALGRFVASGDRRTGTAFYDEWRKAGRLIDRLDVLVATDRHQSAHVRVLRRLYEQRRAELAPPAIRATYRQGLPALTLFAAAGASETLPRIDRTLERIADHEETLLGRRADNALTLAEWSNRLTDTLSIAGAVLMLVALGLTGLAARAYAARHAAREQAEVERDRAGALARAVEERTRALSEANGLLKAEAEERRLAEAQRAQVEDQLRQMQKMEAVGQLTGGIAHDFNNMLSVVVGGLDMARRRLAAGGDDAAAHIDSALEGANRAAALTRQLLTFSRAEPLLPQAIDPGALAAGMADLIDRTIGERIAVTIACVPDPWPVFADRYQLENAILNLVVNARDAMDGAGAITVSVANEVVAGPRGGIDAGDYVRIAVADEGCGMTPEVLARAFEPFFTTKPVGRGTGLGLSQIFGLARQSGGTVEIDSAPGRGTTVSILLPRAEAGAAPGAAPAPDLPQPTAAAGETVLVVEDDPRVRHATTAALAELGYRPLPVGSAEEALALLDGGAPVALILTDVMMPGTTGPELVRMAAARHAGVPALFVTGFAGGAGDAPELAGRAVLRKPFTVAALAAAVAAALARGG